MGCLISKGSQRKLCILTTFWQLYVSNMPYWKFHVMHTTTRLLIYKQLILFDQLSFATNHDSLNCSLLPLDWLGLGWLRIQLAGARVEPIQSKIKSVIFGWFI